MSLKLNFDFVSPMSLLFSGEVDSVLIPAKEGDAAKKDDKGKEATGDKKPSGEKKPEKK